MNETASLNCSVVLTQPELEEALRDFLVKRGSRFARGTMRAIINVARPQGSVIGLLKSNTDDMVTTPLVLTEGMLLYLSEPVPTELQA